MITSSQCRAARALAEISREHLARISDVSEQTIANFERKLAKPDDKAIEDLQHALERVGVLFIAEDSRGIGVRLKFTRSEARRIGILESEGGRVGDDDVPS